MSSDLTGVTGLNSITLGSTAARATVAPRSSFSSALDVVKRIFGVAASPVDFAGSGIDPQYQGLIEQQMKMQEQMQLVSLYSNIIKSEHETQMAAVRNVRVG